MNSSPISNEKSPNTPQNNRSKRTNDDMSDETQTPKNNKHKKRKQSESSGDENWLRPTKCNKCSEIFSEDPIKWNRHNIEKHIRSHNDA